MDYYKKTVGPSYSSSWLLNYPNARSIFWRRSPRPPSALSRIIDYSKWGTAAGSGEVKGMLFWEKDIPFLKSLGNEVCRWQTLWQSTDRELPNNLLLALNVCDEDGFPNIYRLLVVACTLPITIAEAEQFFSLIKCIKTCSRSTMEQFSDFAVICTTPRNSR